MPSWGRAPSCTAQFSLPLDEQSSASKVSTANTHVYKSAGAETAEMQCWMALVLPAALLPTFSISGPAEQVAQSLSVSISAAANELCPSQLSWQCTQTQSPLLGSRHHVLPLIFIGGKTKQPMVCFLFSWEILEVVSAPFCASFTHLQTDPNPL